MINSLVFLYSAVYVNTLCNVYKSDLLDRRDRKGLDILAKRCNIISIFDLRCVSLILFYLWNLKLHKQWTGASDARFMLKL